MWLRIGSEGRSSINDPISDYNVVSSSLTFARRIPLLYIARHLVCGLYYGRAIPSITAFSRQNIDLTIRLNIQRSWLTNRIKLAWIQTFQKLYICSRQKISSRQITGSIWKRRVWAEFWRVGSFEEFACCKSQKENDCKKGIGAYLVQRINSHSG